MPGGESDIADENNSFAGNQPFGVFYETPQQYYEPGSIADKNNSEVFAGTSPSHRFFTRDQ